MSSSTTNSGGEGTMPALTSGLTTSEAPGPRNGRGIISHSDSSSNSSPFFSRTFSDLTLFELASSLLDDKPAASRLATPQEGQPLSALDWAEAPWTGASASPLPVPPPGAGCEDAGESFSSPAVTQSQHVEEALATLVRSSPPRPRPRSREPDQRAKRTPPPTKVTRAEAVSSPGTARTHALAHPVRPAQLLFPPPPPVRPPPSRVACLFVEVSCEALGRTSGDCEAMRRLLSRWCGLEPIQGAGTAVTSTAVTRAREADVAQIPPDHRLVLFLAPTVDSLRQSLLSFTLQPFAENAALTPLFGCCTGTDPNAETSAISPTHTKDDAESGRPSLLKTKRDGKALKHKRDSVSRLPARRVTFAEPVVSTCSTPAVPSPPNALSAAVRDAVCLLHVDVASSVGLVCSESGRAALRSAGVRVPAVQDSITSTMQYLDREAAALVKRRTAEMKSEKKRSASSLKQKRGQNNEDGDDDTCPEENVHDVLVAPWHTVALRGSVDEGRSLALRRLASWNSLARQLWLAPRRPALVLRRVRVPSPSPSSSSSSSGCGRAWLFGAVCAAVSHQETLPLTTATRDLRMRLAEAPALRITWSQRAMLTAFGTFLFGPSVMSTAINVLQAYGEEIGRETASADAGPRQERTSSYVKSFYCVCTGYQRYRITATLRRYVHTTLDLHLVELWESSSAKDGMEASVLDVFTAFFPECEAPSGSESVPEGPWRRVIPHLSCTCVPRSFERVRRTSNGTKLCRHVAELLFYAVQRQCIPTLGDQEVTNTAGACDELVSACEIPPLGQLIAKQRQPRHVWTPFQPDEAPPAVDSGAGAAFAHPPSWGSNTSRVEQNRAHMKSQTAHVRAKKDISPVSSGETIREEEDSTGGTPATKRRRKEAREEQKSRKREEKDQKKQERERQKEEKRERKAMEKKAKKNEERRLSAHASHSSSRSSLRPSEEAHAADADSSFHQRALEYSLNLIRTRAATLIQSQLAALNAAGGGGGGVAVSSLPSDSPEAVPPLVEVPVRAPDTGAASELGALAWLQALLEVPDPVQLSQLFQTPSHSPAPRSP